jgi:hypothetical protein
MRSLRDSLVDQMKRGSGTAAVERLTCLREQIGITTAQVPPEERKRGKGKAEPQSLRGASRGSSTKVSRLGVVSGVQPFFPRSDGDGAVTANLIMSLQVPEKRYRVEPAPASFHTLAAS